MIEILASGTGPAQSADFVVLAGAPHTLMMIGEDPAAARIAVQIKTLAGAYQTIGFLSSIDTASRARLVSAPGTYRVVRQGTGAAVSVEKEV